MRKRKERSPTTAPAKAAKNAKFVDKRRIIAPSYTHSVDVIEHYLGKLEVECQFCKALHFQGEQKGDHFTDCCHDGKVAGQVQPIRSTSLLTSLITGTSREAVNFRTNARSYNNALALGSIEANIVKFNGGGPPFYKIHGQMYHRVGSTTPAPGYAPSYAQLYFMDTGEALRQMQGKTENHKCLDVVMAELQTMLYDVNQNVQHFKHMREIEAEEEALALAESRSVNHVSMFVKADGSRDIRRYNTPTTEEIAVVFEAKDGAPPSHHDIVLCRRNGPLKHISSLHPLGDAFVYPLIHPFGNPGWQPGMKHNPDRATRTRDSLTLLQYYCYQIAIRNDGSHIHGLGQLFQQFCVGAYVKVEGQRLTFLRGKQKELRVDSYKGLIDFAHSKACEDGIRAGKIVVLPSSFIGSPRNMHQNCLDALSMVCSYGRPDLFVTMTMNPKCKEVTENLGVHQKASDRPDLIARVFDLKLHSLLDDILKKHVFGKVKAHTYTIEFQKRGLPHAHILLILDPAYKLREISQIDGIISAEIPNPETNKELHDIVVSTNLHGPCGKANPKAPCMKDGVCSKNFPKPFQETTLENDNGYAKYRRRDDKVSVVKNGCVLDNRHVVPYNPYLTKKYNCHINVEMCATVKCVKYLFKYIWKGYDAADVVFEDTINHDEIDAHLSGRYVGSTEAVWRLLEKKMYDMSHTVIRLSIHLPGEQNVVFVEGNEIEKSATEIPTKLTAFFQKNAESIEARGIKYGDFPTQFVWDDKNHSWKDRQRGGDKIISRIYQVPPSHAEKFSLRLLLLNVAGATSFEDLRTIDGIVYETFREAARVRLLLGDDEEWRECFKEAIETQTARQLRELLAYICVFNRPSDPKALWEEFKFFLTEDFEGTESREDRALSLIQEILQANGTSCLQVGLPPPGNFQPLALSTYQDRRVYDDAFKGAYSQLNPQQVVAVDTILEAAYKSQQKSKCIFINGPAGTGKTFVYKCVLDKIRSLGDSAIVVAFTGIAASLIPGGRTLHTTFQLGIPLTECSVSGIKMNSPKAEAIRQAQLILWDEGPMAPGIILTVVDRFLRDVMKSTLPFGGKTIVIGGDFKQVLPVMPHAARPTIVEASLKKNELWTHFAEHKLTENMRADAEATVFSKYLTDLGSGSLETHPEIGEDVIRLPDECVISGSIVNAVYGDKISCSGPPAGVVILCPKNEECDAINQEVLDIMEGPERVYTSFDEMTDGENATANFPIEFANSLNPNGLPPHCLRLKLGATVILVRNMKRGMVNGTRMKVKQMKNNVIVCEVLFGECIGEDVLLPRIIIETMDGNLPFTLRRRQFPIKLAFAMTANKSQGQTFETIGINLKEPFFTHGQLYVAMSRVRRFASVKIKVENADRQGKFKGKEGTYTRNPVFKEVL